MSVVMPRLFLWKVGHFTIVRVQWVQQWESGLRRLEPTVHVQAKYACRGRYTKIKGEE